MVRKKGIGNEGLWYWKVAIKTDWWKLGRRSSSIFKKELLFSHGMGSATYWRIYTLEFQRKFRQEDFKANEEGTTLKLWITKKDDERKIIGWISFSLIVRGILQSCILGYKLDQDEVNNGCITEGLWKAISVVFEELKLHLIEAPIMLINNASINVVSKLGFTNEGIAKKLIKINGRWEDHMRWALINDIE